MIIILIMRVVYYDTNKKQWLWDKEHCNNLCCCACLYPCCDRNNQPHIIKLLRFFNAAYTDGQTATIQIAGAVDDAQSGLTTASVHYVQNDTLSTSAGTPSVEAGLALSATEIAIKA